MKTASKVWGRTYEVFATPTFEVHHLIIDGPHRCSRHRHMTKYNGFYVQSGAIQVTVWQPTGLVDYTVLERGQSLVVPPGVDHMFEGISDESHVLEAYWTELQRDDIVRMNTGE